MQTKDKVITAIIIILSIVIFYTDVIKPNNDAEEYVEACNSLYLDLGIYDPESFDRCFQVGEVIRTCNPIIFKINCKKYSKFIY